MRSSSQDFSPIQLNITVGPSPTFLILYKSGLFVFRGYIKQILSSLLKVVPTVRISGNMILNVENFLSKIYTQWDIFVSYIWNLIFPHVQVSQYDVCNTSK